MALQAFRLQGSACQSIQTRTSVVQHTCSEQSDSGSTSHSAKLLHSEFPPASVKQTQQRPTDMSALNNLFGPRKPNISMNQLSQQKPNQWLNHFILSHDSLGVGSSVMGPRGNMMGQPAFSMQVTLSLTHQILYSCPPLAPVAVQLAMIWKIASMFEGLLPF